MSEFKLRPGIIYPDELRDLVIHLGILQKEEKQVALQEVIEASIIKMAVMAERIKELRDKNWELQKQLNDIESQAEDI